MNVKISLDLPISLLELIESQEDTKKHGRSYFIREALIDRLKK